MARPPATPNGPREVRSFRREPAAADVQHDALVQLLGKAVEEWSTMNTTMSRLADTIEPIAQATLYLRSRVKRWLIIALGVLAATGWFSEPVTQALKKAVGLE